MSCHAALNSSWQSALHEAAPSVDQNLFLSAPQACRQVDCNGRSVMRVRGKSSDRSGYKTMAGFVSEFEV